LIDVRDNVATALEDLAAGSEVQVGLGRECGGVRLRADIPRGHKFALLDIPAGSPVVKYGEPIGVAARAIALGEHVHVHNVASRPCGDLA
jgi:altronate dehydratase